MARERYALVSMPWFWAYLPSIQLAIVSDVLDDCGAESDIYEFYADLVDATGIHLYKAIANASGYTGELLFSQFYYPGRGQQHRVDRPYLGLATKELEDTVFDFLSPVIESALDAWFSEVDWSSYSAVCFSLTASQTAASMAMARRVRQAHPKLPIVFGGSSCAGAMGSAIARVCPEVDVVVHGEAETSLPQLVEALRGKRSLAEVPGITWRSADGLVTNERAPLHRLGRTRGPLNFDSYYRRVGSNGVLQKHGVWIPFESSRGCWYGEKAQCTFCGLNEIIRYRERGAQGLLAELEHYEARYGAKNFFAVDLIMPRSFFSDFLPSVAAAGKEWTIFYEIKSNMSREEMERLAAGRVRWIQPGIESLDDDILKLMRKGVTAAHNIQTLKWARELSINASWNLITGFPREKASSYFQMARLFPRLHHLLPPVGLGDFEVHRFSPYFEAPTEHGIQLLGAYPHYREVYPVEPADLDDLVYRHDYRLTDAADPDLPAARRAAAAAVAEWRAASKRGAGFTWRRRSDGGIDLLDSRAEAESVRTALNEAEGRLLLFLDEMRPETRLAALFAEREPEALAALGGCAGLERTLERWDEAGIVLRKSGYALGLPLPAERIGGSSERRRKEDAGTRLGVDAIGHDEPDQRAEI